MNIPGLEDFLATAARHRVVLLGECSHDMHEFYQIKTEIVRRLVEDYDFSLLIFEAGMASCSQAMRDGVPSLERLEGLYNFARTPAMHAFFQWWDLPEIHPKLAIVGMDPRVLKTGVEFIADSLRTLGYDRADAVADTERALHAVWRRLLLVGADGGEEKEIATARVVLVGALEWLASIDEPTLDGRVLERILLDRLSLLDAMKTEAQYYDWRERHMAANVDWWTREVYPDRKTIIWGHNYHTMRRHSAINGEATMGEHIAPELMSDAFSLGVYAHSGTGTFPDRKPFTIAPAPEGSLEHYGIEEGESARFTVFRDPNGWWRRPSLSRLFGIEEEALVPNQQYDGVLVVRDVHPQEIVDKEILRRIV
jgi:erythromycin esterase